MVQSILPDRVSRTDRLFHYIAPAFFSAAIYLCFGDVGRTFSEDISRFGPWTYAAIFIPFDLVSLVLQGMGGVLASVKAQNEEDPTLGTNIMITGLGFQVISMILFMVLAVDYVLRLKKWRETNVQTSQIPVTERRLLFLPFSGLAITCMFIRCIYRVVGPSDGWTGHLMHDETTIIALEST